MKRLAVIVSALALLLYSPVPGAAVEPSEAPPDIIVVMLDDMGAEADVDIRVMERLPHIRALFLPDTTAGTSGGMSLDLFGETPLCCPGRAAFLTGQHTRRHGVDRLDARRLDATQTIATALDAVGYHTVQIGKYLNKAALLTDHTPPGWDRVAMFKAGTADGSSSEWWVNDIVQTRPAFMNDSVRQRAVRWLQAAPPDAPLFMWLAPTAPHRSSVDLEPVVSVRDRGDARCADIPPFRPPSYGYAAFPEGWPLVKVCESLLTVDRMVGAMRAKAALAGRDPIWIMTSDNGMAWGIHGYPQKNAPWATRLPFHVAGPGIVPGHVDAMQSQMDLASTIAELGGAVMPWAQAQSFTPALFGRPWSGREQLLEDHPKSPLSWGDDSGMLMASWSAIRTPDRRLIRWADGREELYQIGHDPWEQQDLAATEPDVRAELGGRLDELLAGAE